MRQSEAEETVIISIIPEKSSARSSIDIVHLTFINLFSMIANDIVEIIFIQISR